MADEIKSIFDLEEFKPYQAAFESRRNRFTRYWRYYKADLMTVKGEFESAIGKYVGSRISDAIKPLFTPLARAVNLDVALIPGDWTLAAQAQPFQEAFNQVMEWSKWEIEGDVYVRYGVAMGESGLRVVDDRLNGRVLIQPVRPDTYLAIYANAWDVTPTMTIFVTVTGETEIAEVIEPTRIRSYKNGNAYAVDPKKGRLEEYANVLGYVPFVVCKHDVGDGLGEPTFDDTLTALEQVNRQATYMSIIISRHAEPQWAVIGAEAGDLEKSGESVWFFPEGSDVKAVLAAVDFEGLLKFIQEIKEEMKDSLPELALSELVGVERVAAATIELQMAEAVFKIRRLRKPHDWALAQAVRLAGRAAASMNLANLTTLDSPLLAFDKNRPVIGVDALTRLQIESAAQNQQISKMAFAREQALLAASRGSESNG